MSDYTEFARDIDRAVLWFRVVAVFAFVAFILSVVNLVALAVR